jgi:hypothetical protein
MERECITGGSSSLKVANHATKRGAGEAKQLRFYQSDSCTEPGSMMWCGFLCSPTSVRRAMQKMMANASTSTATAFQVLMLEIKRAPVTEGLSAASD